MTNAYNNLKPGAMPVAFTKAITSAATDTLIWRVPWGNPVNKCFEPRKIIFTCNANSGGALTIWDQDLSSATPTKNGSAGAALITVAPIAATASTSGQGSVITVISENQMPQIVFQAGLTCNAPIGTFVAIEGQVY